MVVCSERCGVVRWPRERTSQVCCISSSMGEAHILFPPTVKILFNCNNFKYNSIITSSLLLAAGNLGRPWDTVVSLPDCRLMTVSTILAKYVSCILIWKSFRNSFTFSAQLRLLLFQVGHERFGLRKANSYCHHLLLLQLEMKMGNKKWFLAAERPVAGDNNKDRRLS